MQTLFWKLYLMFSIIAIIIVMIHVLFNRGLSILLKIAGVFLLISTGWWGYQQYMFYEKQIPFSKIEPNQNIKLLPPLPLEEEPIVEKYLLAMNRDRPIIIAFPLDVFIRFTDPVNPSSPHAIFRVLFANKGNLKATDMSVEWNIIDNGCRITPPEEWEEKINGQRRKPFILLPQQNFIYIYGPEIGAYAASEKPRIELELTVNYKGEDGKQFTYYCKSKLKQKEYPKRTYYFDISEVK